MVCSKEIAPHRDLQPTRSSVLHTASVAFAVFLAVAQVAASSIVPQMAESATTESFVDAARLVVMIECSLEGSRSQGAGIIFAVKNNNAYVLTANHVVRSSAPAKDVRVFFSTSPDAPVPAIVEPQFSLDLDLTVLEVSLSSVDPQSQKELPFRLLEGDPSKLEHGRPVYPIGYPEGYKWRSPLLLPDRFDRSAQDRFYFEGADVQPGYSGGAVCSSDWRVIGMVLAVAQAPNVMALPIQRAIRQVADWGFEIGNVKNAAQPVIAPQTSSGTNKNQEAWKPMEGGLKEGLTEKGAGFRSFSPWGGFPNSDQSWVRLLVQRVEGIPPQKTWLGNPPDFAFVVVDKSGSKTSVDLNKENRVTFDPAREEDLDGALIHLTGRSSMSIWDVTYPEKIEFPRVRQGHRLILRYTDNVLDEVRNKTDKRELTSFLQAQGFLPDGQSGKAANPATAEALAPGSLKEYTVSFNDSRATRHEILNPAGGDCKSILWIEVEGEVGLTSTQRKAGQGSTSLILENPAARGMRFYEVQCSGQRTILRIQAEQPGSSAKYSIFAGSRLDLDYPQLEYRLIHVWIESWINAKKTSTSFGSMTSAEWNSLDRGLQVLRKHTSSAPDAFILAVNDSLGKGTGEFFSEIRDGYWGFVEQIVSRHRDEISRALATCCSASSQVRFMTNLVRAEARLPYDESAFEWAKTDTQLPEKIKTRVNRFIPARAANP